MTDTTIDIENPALEAYIKKVVLETLKTALAESPPQNELALLLHLHIKDMQSFRISVENELSAIKNRLDRIEGRLDQIDGRLDRVEGRLDQVDGRLDRVEGRLDRIEGRLDRIEDTMMTKAYWEEEKNRLLEGIGAKVVQIIDERIDKKLDVLLAEIKKSREPVD